jgi:hypothetical protein
VEARPPHDTRPSPYQGLEPFDERDAAFFFGRERETRLIAASLFAGPLTLLYGASGVGKSSVLRAGVVPLLRADQEVLPIVFPTVSIDGAAPASSPSLRGWQTDPLGGIKETVALALFAAASTGTEADRYRKVVRDCEMGPLREFLSACSEAANRRLMVILDQFEEYSLYHPDDDAFAEQFPRAIVRGDLSASFVVSLREDALARLDRFKGSIPTLWDSYRRIDHLSRPAAESAIRLPLQEYNRRQPAGQTPMVIEDALVAAVLRDVQAGRFEFADTGGGTIANPTGRDTGIETPYLQLVMTRLWEREQAEGSTTLRLATLQAEGSAPQIVKTHLDRVMAQFTAEEQDLAAKVFHRLVTPSGAKIAFSAGDLAQYEAVSPEQLTPILRRLEEGSRRILRRVAIGAGASAEPRYEIFHDRLGKAILSWRAKRLQEQERERTQRDEAQQKRLAEAARAKNRDTVQAAMSRLGVERQAIWARLLIYLVSTDGRRLSQTVADLAKFSEQPAAAVGSVVDDLFDSHVVRHGYGGAPSSSGPAYEVADDGMAAALLEWHAQYVVGQTRATQSDSDQAHAVAAVRHEAPTGDGFPFALVRNLLRQQRVVPFLGAGVGLSARPQRAADPTNPGPFLPSNRELKEMLARECGFPTAAFEAADIAEVAAFYEQHDGRAELDAFLERTLGSPDYVPSRTHRFLAQEATLTPLLILSTNYDTLMEQALDDAGAPYDVFAYALERSRRGAIPPGASPPVFPLAFEVSPERTAVVRLHGPAVDDGQKFGSYVLTEEDQIEWLLALRTDRSALPPPVLERVFRSHLLSLGHSARDWSQRALLRTLYEGKKRDGRSSWAVALNPAPLSVMTWQRYGVDVYSLELNEWTARMEQA